MTAALHILQDMTAAGLDVDLLQQAVDTARQRGELSRAQVEPVRMPAGNVR